MVDLFIVCLEIKATVLQFNHLYLKPLVFVLKTISLPPFFHPFIYKDETFSPGGCFYTFFRKYKTPVSSRLHVRLVPTEQGMLHRALSSWWVRWGGFLL